MKSSIDGLDKLIFKLDSMSATAKNLKPILEEIGKDMKTKTDFCFRLEKSPEGVSWKKSKRNGKTLSNTGALKRSISYSTSSDSATVGTNLKYAKTMHYGASKHSFGYSVAKIKAFTRKNGSKVKAHSRYMQSPWGDIPARPFIGISNNQMLKYRKMIANYLGIK